MRRVRLCHSKRATDPLSGNTYSEPGAFLLRGRYQVRREDNGVWVVRGSSLRIERVSRLALAADADEKRPSLEMLDEVLLRSELRDLFAEEKGACRRSQRPSRVLKKPPPQPH